LVCINNNFPPYGTTIALLGGSFVAFLLGLFLVYMGLVAWKWLLTIIGVIIFYNHLGSYFF